MAEEHDDLEQRGLIAHSYSNFFKIRKRIRKVQDISLPMRRGLGVEQFVTFFLVVIALLVFYGTVLAPLFVLTGVRPGWRFYLLYFLVPAVLLAIRVGKPMKSGKSIPGSVRSLLRKVLDDPVHRRGVPLRHRPAAGSRMHYLRIWQAHPTLRPHLPPGSTYDTDPPPGGQRVDLDTWLESVVTERAATLPRVVGTDDDAWRRRMRGAAGRVVVPGEDDDPKGADQ
ncbi:TcpE family conjugal transfer membrane protein [Dactylosporangium sp. NPDC050688]|uniref:TcpE family conjugal transfer membrane protein n=1 Tax=Dactylosporangium sp. NPDC050688 TaxID=3157217 RepID=UPI0033E27CD4